MHRAYAQELPFCGHGTMGAANVLFSLHSAANLIRFNAKPGQIIARRQDDGVELSLPIIPLEDETPNAKDLAALIAQVSSVTPDDIVELVTFTWSGLGIVVELKPGSDLGSAKIDGRGLVSAGQAAAVSELTPRQTHPPGWSSSRRWLKSTMPS